ncbi:MAG TPA: RNA-directed DNA polymerase [Ktedonobacteraceae bacterium]|nr:RNA-directed DNA polymerase [Ktedonobacteraceae bacterium]
MLKLRSESYEWAITHLLKKRDTDLFPQPFELKAIASFPDDAKKTLQTTDLGSYSWYGGRNTIVPKGTLSFRLATQLDPWDSLILTALIYEIGNAIEKMRIPQKEEIVSSYRFWPIKSEGDMYDVDADWPSFWSKSRERAANIGGYVAIADVSSYYNQIYHHTLENQLQVAGVPSEAAKSIIRLCSKVTQGVSRGIPVGPHATHLLAECAFDPIDRSLLAEGYTFCRFVDDIHIFCKTWEQAQIAFYDLAEILDKQQRLSLQSHKSKILSAAEFIEYANNVVVEAPHNPLEKDIIEVIDRYSKGDRYRNIDFAVLSADDLNILSQENLTKLLNGYLDQPEPNFVRIRWFFRRLAQVGVPGAVSLAVTKLEKFSPAIADLASYLLSAKDNYTGVWRDLGDEVLGALEIPIIQHSEYLTVILLDLFAGLPALNHVENILQKYRRSSSMIQREIVRIATAHKASYWLRQRKEALPSADPWLKRALIAGASTFSKDERTYWLQRIEREGTDLEKFVARWTRTAP